MYLSFAWTLAVALAAVSCPNADRRAPGGVTPSADHQMPGHSAPSSTTRVDTMAARQPPQQPLTHLVTQQTSGYRLGNEGVIRDQAAWTGAWQSILGGLPGGDPAPAVDFTRDMVILVALGEVNTGGITIHVDSASHDGGALLVRYTVTEPGAECMTTQALTAPIDVVRVPRTAGEVRFERRTVRRPC